MNLGLSGKVAVVTGASKGIGLAITKMFVEEGAQVVAGARTVDGLAGLPGVTALKLDLAAPDGHAKLVAAALEQHGRLDALVNNVGAVRLRLGGFLGTSDEEFEWSMQMNFFAAVRATRAALGPMLKAGGGAIVNVASVNAFFEPDAGVLDYGAAKAALVNFTKSIAMEFGPRGVRVNAVSPSLAMHPLLAKVTTDELLAELTKKEAFGRAAEPWEVANVMVFLASDYAGYLTGEVLSVSSQHA